MRRRDFITLLGGAAVAWPLAVRAQQRERMRRIGVLMPYAANDPQAQARNAAFLQGLQQLGWTVGHNVEIEYRWSGGNIDDTRQVPSQRGGASLGCSRQLLANDVSFDHFVGGGEQRG